MPDTPHPDQLAIEASIRARVEQFAADNGYKLNPDAKIVSLVIRGLAKRQIKTGKPYCPCRVLTGDPDKDEANVCPCEHHKEEIERDGICHCRILTSPDYPPAQQPAPSFEPKETYDGRERD